MNAAELALHNLITANAAIRAGLRAENENAIVRYCLITEEPLVGPAAGDEGVVRHYYYSPSYITIADNHYSVVASIPDLSVAHYNEDGEVRFLRMYLLLHRENEPVAMGTLQLAQVLVELDQNVEAAAEIMEGLPVIPLSQAKNHDFWDIIREGLQTLGRIATGEQEVW